MTVQDEIHHPSTPVVPVDETQVTENVNTMITVPWIKLELKEFVEFKIHYVEFVYS